MARVCTQAEAKRLGLPGRTALELVSGEKGARAITLRLVEIPVPSPGETPRGPHQHSDFEECIYVLSGRGTTHADSGTYELRAGDALLVPPGEKHVTRNTGNKPLLLLCFFPVADISGGTREPGVRS
ncbi:MAG TPA: cupin domain-containing protein [Terriglobales bacterium]|jgi:quercetin dioxygenase-like cupin family protein|nr:cupin domain-containing protein [Terriglobales bacterium]